MRYQVEIEGQKVEVSVEQTVSGLSVRVGDGESRLASLKPRPAPLHTLSHGDLRCELALEGDQDDPAQVSVTLPGHTPRVVRVLDARFAGLARREGAGNKKLKRVKCPMPGVVVEVRVEAGSEVEKGAVLLILEAMKMQNEIRAEGEGIVKAVRVNAGDSVAAGDLLVEF